MARTITVVQLRANLDQDLAFTKDIEKYGKKVQKNFDTAEILNPVSTVVLLCSVVALFLEIFRETPHYLAGFVLLGVSVVLKIVSIFMARKSAQEEEAIQEKIESHLNNVWQSSTPPMFSIVEDDDDDDLCHVAVVLDGEEYYIGRLNKSDSILRDLRKLSDD